MGILKKTLPAAILLAATQAGALTLDSTFNNQFLTTDLTTRGLNISVFPGEGDKIGIAFAAYFTYDNEGNATWVAGSFPYDEGQNKFITTLVTADGGQFGPGSQPNDPQQAVEVELTFNSCGSIDMNYTAKPGFENLIGNGSLEFTTIAGDSSCAYTKPFNGTSCPAGTTPYSDIEGACLLTGNPTTDMTLTNDHSYVLRGGVFFGEDLGPEAGTEGATLTIEPGTLIIGEAELSFLSINRGNKIHAEGTKDAPIVFTGLPYITDGDQSFGQWGGLNLLGRAGTKGCSAQTGCETGGVEAEAGIGVFGGTDDHDNSGVLRYTRVEFGGSAIDSDNEHNGMTFFGVGDGTVVDHLQAHKNGDDALEWFGGTMNAKYLVATDVADDSIDWQKGYRGHIQYALVRQTADAFKDPRCFEGDNDRSNPEVEPKSHPQIANVTCLLAESPVGDPSAGARIRRGTEGNFSKIILTGEKEKSCIRVTEQATVDNILDGTLTIDNSIVDCKDGDNFSGDGAADHDADSTVESWFTNGTGNAVVDPQMNGFMPGAPALNKGDLDRTTFGPFFDNVNFAGGVTPANKHEYVGWTRFLDL